MFRQVTHLAILDHHPADAHTWPSGLPFIDKTPLERAKFLETTDIFADIHAAAAASGQSAVPENLDTDLHFTCFVQAPEASARAAETTTDERRLIELDGRRAGPVDRGKSTDLLKVRATWNRALFTLEESLLSMWPLF
jgi:ubiquitin carboxyl-terminal hydrolase L3